MERYLNEYKRSTSLTNGAKIHREVVDALNRWFMSHPEEAVKFATFLNHAVLRVAIRQEALADWRAKYNGWIQESTKKEIPSGMKEIMNDMNRMFEIFESCGIQNKVTVKAIREVIAPFGVADFEEYVAELYQEPQEKSKRKYHARLFLSYVDFAGARAVIEPIAEVFGIFDDNDVDFSKVDRLNDLSNEEAREKFPDLLTQMSAVMKNLDGRWSNLVQNIVIFEPGALSQINRDAKVRARDYLSLVVAYITAVTGLTKAKIKNQLMEAFMTSLRDRNRSAINQAITAFTKPRRVMFRVAREYAFGKSSTSEVLDMPFDKDALESFFK